MSASKKKMQRREAVDTEKIDQAQAEQTAYKKKVRLYTIIGIVIVVLVAALLVWNSGIFQKKAAAATVGETEITVEELSYFYYGSRYMYSYMGYLDSTKSDADQIYDSAAGTTWQDYFLETALTQAQTVQARYDAALKAGYSDADVADSVASQIESLKASASASGYTYKSYLANIYGRYMTPAAFERMLVRDLLGSKYYNETATDKYDSYSADQLEAYYAEHKDSIDTITYSYFYFKADAIAEVEGKELTDEEKEAQKTANMAAAKAKAEAMLADYQSGTPLIKIEELHEPTSSSIENSAVGTDTISSLYREELLKLGENEGTIVESTDYGYYVVIFHNRGRNEDLTADVRHILISAETTTDADNKTVAPTEEAWAAAKTEAEKLLAEYESGSKTAEAFGVLANEHSEDGGSNTNGGLYEGVAQGDFVAEFDEWIYAEEGRSEGDTALIRHEGDIASTSSYWGYHVTYFQGWSEAEWQLTARSQMSTEDMDTWSEELANACPATLHDAAKHLGK